MSPRLTCKGGQARLRTRTENLFITSVDRPGSVVNVRPPVACVRSEIEAVPRVMRDPRWTVVAAEIYVLYTSDAELLGVARDGWSCSAAGYRSCAQLEGCCSPSF